MIDTAEGAPRVIDAKFPLSWLVGCSAAIVFSMGGVFFKINTIGETVAKIENKTDIRDDRTNVLAQSIIALQGSDQTQKVLIERLSSDVAEAKRDIEEVRRRQTWAPK